QKLLNEIHAKQWLTRLVNANFSPGDSYITLTYRGKEPTLAQAKKELERYLRRLRDLRKKNDLPALKYISVTEITDCRVNHHIITQHMNEAVLMDLWQKDGKGNPIKGHGRIPIDRLDWSFDYTFLSRYVGKEKKMGKRWSQSKNLTKPKVSEAKEIARSTIRKSYRPPKGYRIAEEIFNSSDTTGEYRYIRLVPITDELDDTG
ncbi:MAG: hypothetical protein RSF82_11955, partial [Angelakisella sp.]